MDNIQTLKNKLDKLKHKISTEEEIRSDSMSKSEKYYYHKLFYGVRNLNGFFENIQDRGVFVVSDQYREEKAKRDDVIDKLDSLTRFIKSASPMLDLYNALIKAEDKFQHGGDPYKFEERIKEIYSRYSTIQFEGYMNSMIFGIISSYRIYPKTRSKEKNEESYQGIYKKERAKIDSLISFNRSKSEFFEEHHLKTYNFTNILDELLDYFLSRDLDLNDKECQEKLEFFYTYSEELYDYQLGDGRKVDSVKQKEQEIILSNQDLCGKVGGYIADVVNDYYEDRLNSLEYYLEDIKKIGRLESHIYNKYIMFIYQCCNLFKDELEKYDLDTEDKNTHLNKLADLIDDVDNYYQVTNCRNIEDDDYHSYTIDQ